jgi:hypothetical protein
VADYLSEIQGTMEPDMYTYHSAREFQRGLEDEVAGRVDAESYEADAPGSAAACYRRGVDHARCAATRARLRAAARALEDQLRGRAECPECGDDGGEEGHEDNGLDPGNDDFALACRRCHLQFSPPWAAQP